MQPDDDATSIGEAPPDAPDDLPVCRDDSSTGDPRGHPPGRCSGPHVPGSQGPATAAASTQCGAQGV